MTEREAKDAARRRYGVEGVAERVPDPDRPGRIMCRVGFFYMPPGGCAGFEVRGTGATFGEAYQAAVAGDVDDPSRVRAGAGLLLVRCEDWFVYAEDESGNLYMFNAECWGGWASLPVGSDAEPGAVRRYVLPWLCERWGVTVFSLVCKRADREDQTSPGDPGKEGSDGLC